MFRHVLFAIAILAGMAGSVQADVGVPSIGPPDFAKSSPAANASFGLSLAAMLICGGYWVIRNPRAGLASLCLARGLSCCCWGFSVWPFGYLLSVPSFSGAGRFLCSGASRATGFFRAGCPLLASICYSCFCRWAERWRRSFPWTSSPGPTPVPSADGNDNSKWRHTTGRPGKNRLLPSWVRARLVCWQVLRGRAHLSRLRQSSLEHSKCALSGATIWRKSPIEI